MRRFFSVILIIIAVVTLTLFVTCTVQGIKRSDWIVTDAEITFVEIPGGYVLGTFKDRDGNVHSEMPLYTDGKFAPGLLAKGGSRVDPEPYYGKKVRIIYNPAGLNADDFEYLGRYCDSYDIWLKDIVVSGILIAVSAFVFVMLNKEKFIKKA